MTQQMIDVIQAHMRGEKIEWRHAGSDHEWRDPSFLTWNFSEFEYRIAPEPKIPDSIDWSHVAPEFRFMARNHDGAAFVHTEAPRRLNTVWISSTKSHRVERLLASYKRGNMEWQDSLVERPKP